MKNVNAVIATMLVVFALAMPTIASIGMEIEGENYEFEIDAGWAAVAPTIDGEIDEDEYANATVIDMEYYSNSTTNRNDTIYIYFMNDNDWLYIAVDVLPDNTSTEGDFCYIAFDEDNNDEWEPDLPDFEAWYGVETVNYSGELIIVSDSLKPLLYAGGQTTTMNDDEEDHAVWEFAIPLSAFIYGELETGDTVGIAMMGGGSLPDVWDYPINISQENETDAELWTKLTLAIEPPVVVEEETDAGTYGMMFIGIGAVILLMLVVFYKETFVKWIGDGNYKLMFIVFGLDILLLFLGLLQWYYDWLGWLGI